MKSCVVMEALAGLLGAVVGGVLVLVGDIGRRWADARQSQVRQLADAAADFSIRFAQLVGDIRDARERGQPADSIPSRRGRYEAAIRLMMTPGCEEVREDSQAIVDAYWDIAQLPSDNAIFDAAVSAYFDAQKEFESKVRSIIRRGSIKQAGRL
jgi:hypothetical protein